MSFPRYPSYKDSGVEWLGEVPEHWEVKRLRFTAELNPSKSEVANLDRETAVSFLPMEAIGDDGTLSLEKEKTIGELENGYTYFRDGDVTVAKITPCYENGKGALMRGLTNGMGFGTTELIVARPKPEHVTGTYLHYLFISPDFRGIGESHMYGAGGQKRVPDAFVRNFATAFPPLAEQTQIAEFLDRETGKIDELVAEQRRLMELLKEKRQAVISHAVTRGLNPAAPLKPSGIEWLGDVPAHWNHGPLKYLATIKTGYAFSSDDFVGEGIPVLRIGDITTDGNVDFTDARCLPEEYGIEHADMLVVRSDIVMAMTGATIGKAGWYDSDRPALLNQRVCIFRSIESNEQRYLWHILSARFYVEHIALAAVGGAQPNISDSQLLQCVVPLPPGPEQVAIAAFLDIETARFDALTAEAQRAIDLLQERRTALISAAVTGQIDVRPLAEKKAA